MTLIPPDLLNRPFIPLATERLLLRPIMDNDVAPMTELAKDKRVAERLERLPHPYSLEEGKKFLDYCQNNLKEGSQVNLAIIRRSDQAFLGMVGVSPELGYWLGVPYWGQGYGKEAVRALVHFAFNSLRMDEIKGSALIENTASRRIFESLGFQEMGEKQCTSKGFEGTRPGVRYALSRRDYLTHYHKPERRVVWVVAAALVNKEGRLLLAERPPGKPMAGVWELPGGKIELGETPEQALIRELYEELHIHVHEENLEALSFASYRYDTFHLVMPYYLCRKWEGSPHGAEGQNLKWVTYEDLREIPTPPADIPLFHHLVHHLKDSGAWE